MSNQEVLEVMKNELKCVKVASSNLCDRNCGQCSLLMSTDRIILAYETVLKMLEKEKEGEWIKDIYGIVICSYCGKPRRDNRVGHINFCNHCGAIMFDMRGDK